MPLKGAFFHCLSLKGLRPCVLAPVRTLPVEHGTTGQDNEGTAQRHVPVSVLMMRVFDQIRSVNILFTFCETIRLVRKRPESTTHTTVGFMFCFISSTFNDS